MFRLVMVRDPIAELVHLYADAVVHRNAEQWGSTWAPDAHWDLGQHGAVKGRDAIVDFWDQAMGQFEAVIQIVLNGTYELDETAGTGTGRWYIQELFRRVAGESGMLVAHYDDRYRRVDGRWCFAGRDLVPHYGGPPDLSARFLTAWGGRRDGDGS